MFPMSDSYLIYGLAFVTQVYSAYFSDLYGFCGHFDEIKYDTE